MWPTTSSQFARGEEPVGPAPSAPHIFCRMPPIGPTSPAPMIVPVPAIARRR